MRLRNKPWAEDYLRKHDNVVDIDGTHAGEMSAWFDKEQPIYIEVGSGMGRSLLNLLPCIRISILFL